MNSKYLGIYIHIPFCIKKCLYCDFLSAPGTAEQIEKYARVVVKEIEEKASLVKGYQIDTIFIGGGTPSVMEASCLHVIIEAIYRMMPLSEKTEFTIECNPGTVSLEKLAYYRKAGINRISFGLQSTMEEELGKLGRIHSYDEFLQSYEWAREAGFINLNVDLMTGIPGQTPESFRTACERVFSCKPEHISVYSLILEPGTPFYERYREKRPVSEETDFEIYNQTKEMLFRAGYKRYEVSNYAVPGYECKHNLKYWSQEDYIGFGIGAASMMQGFRWKNTMNLTEYYKGEFRRYEEEELSKREQMEEFVIFGLRKIKGISLSEFKVKFGEELPEVFRKPIEMYIPSRLLRIDNGWMSFTDKGIDVSNLILEDFICL